MEMLSFSIQKVPKCVKVANLDIKVVETVSIQLDNGSDVPFIDLVVAAVAPHVHSHGNVVTNVSCVVIAGSKIHQPQVSGQGTRFCSRIVYIYNKI
jgi:hypothetical protein